MPDIPFVGLSGYAFITSFGLLGGHLNEVLRSTGMASRYAKYRSSGTCCSGRRELVTVNATAVRVTTATHRRFSSCPASVYVVVMTSDQLQQWWVHLTPATRARLQLNPGRPLGEDIAVEVLDAAGLVGALWPVTTAGPGGLHLPNDAHSWITAAAWRR